MGDRISYERYRLTLRHEFVDCRGISFDLGDPLSVEYIMMRGEKLGIPTPMLLHEMMDKLKAALLDLVKQEEEQ